MAASAVRALTRRPAESPALRRRLATTLWAPQEAAAAATRAYPGQPARRPPDPDTRLTVAGRCSRVKRAPRTRARPTRVVRARPRWKPPGLAVLIDGR